jgi:hypothetical protein
MVDLASRLQQLTPQQALAIVDILDAISAAIWDTHGPAMAAILAHAPEPPEPEHQLPLPLDIPF